MEWSTVSNAADKSRRMSEVTSPRSIARMRSLWITYAQYFFTATLSQSLYFISDCSSVLFLFTDQINSLSKSCHFHNRDIRRIRHLLPLSAATALANSLVSSKLDYCNSLYNGISQANLNKIQRIQNTLARVVTITSKFEHITPILKKLHWLPIKQRIDYKLCLLTYKTLQIQQPTYLYNSLSFPSHSLSTRSSDSSVLSIPYVRTSLGKRAFSVIAPRLWNSLPPDTRNSLSVSTFRSKLKTHLFKLAFPLEFSPILSSDCLPGFDSCFSFTFSPIEWYLVLDTGHWKFIIIIILIYSLTLKRKTSTFYPWNTFHFINVFNSEYLVAVEI